MLLAAAPFALLFGVFLWLDWREAPTDAARMQAQLAAMGHAGAQVRRDWFVHCGRSFSGFDWRTPSHEGYACLDTSQVILRVQPRRHSGWL
jgi:hypothetical protein